MASAASAQTPSTLETVKKRGQLICGVNVGLGGFSLPDSQGKWSGLDVDMCNAVAAAVLGDATKAKYVPLSAQQRFLALQSGEIDMLVRNSTITLERDAGLGLQYAGVNFYDGQGFMVPKKLEREGPGRAGRRHDLRRPGHDPRIQRGELVPRPRHDLQAGGLSKART